MGHDLRFLSGAVDTQVPQGKTVVKALRAVEVFKAWELLHGSVVAWFARQARF